MKRYMIILFMFLAISACKKDEIEMKEGPNLPRVENLKSEAVGANQTRLSWTIPDQISTEIERPLKIILEVNQVTSAMKYITVFNQTIDEEATSFLLDNPADPGEYHVVVRLYGQTKTQDQNYSENIYSLGSTVVFKK